MNISEEKKFDKEVDRCDNALWKQYEIFKSTVQAATNWDDLVKKLGGRGKDGVTPLQGALDGWYEYRLGAKPRVIFRGNGGIIEVKLIDKNHNTCKPTKSTP